MHDGAPARDVPRSECRRPLKGDEVTNCRAEAVVGACSSAAQRG